MRTVLLAALQYFLFVFCAGFLLGTVRVMLIVPRLGADLAELLELPLMVLICYFSARYVINRFDVTGRPAGLAVGGTALLVMVVFEFALVVVLRDLSLRDYLHERATLAGLAYLGSLLLFAWFPAYWAGKRGQPNRGT